MKARHAGVVVALLALGCGAGTDRAGPRPVASPAGTRPVDQAAYLQSLARIDEGLVADRERAIRRAEQTCADIRAGVSGRDLTDRVVARLSGGDATIDAGQAATAITLMRQRIC